ncbi:hypothetical protein ARMGADRAFT_1082080 [Armillaria gallica]|uniref:Uncharacterized protein n=1 Tax=Armillaria gallica TaxID=47427 RepID=A0A2H3DIH2_ARMGA|nr:hypothetical protein ARMGADRAFT_1082080 [Armillaria gallica]
MSRRASLRESRLSSGLPMRIFDSRRMQEFQETISGDYTWVCTRMDGILGAAMVRRERNVREGNKSELEVGPKFDKEEPAQWHRAELDKEDETKRADKVSPKPRMLSRHTGTHRALDDIPAEPSAMRSGCPNTDTVPSAKRSRRKLTDDTDPDL